MIINFKNRCLQKYSILVLLLIYTINGNSVLRLPTIISDHLVFQQQQQPLPVWGWDAPGSHITVRFAGQKKTTITDKNGNWMIKLDALKANFKPQSLIVEGTSKIIVHDILVGEVWVCSGQSNMQFKLQNVWNGDLEIQSADLPNLRIITLPPDRGTQDLQTDFKGKWAASTPQNISTFSAIGYIFGRNLQQTLKVPVGIINSSWGGTTIRAWIRRSSLESDPRFVSTLEPDLIKEKELLPDNGRSQYIKDSLQNVLFVAKAKEEKKTPPSWNSLPWLSGQSRAGNAFSSMINPIAGFGMKGFIWYQGESDSNNSKNYSNLFCFFIEQLRKEWKQGDFPFYWVQLPKFNATPGSFTSIREAQSTALKLPNTGQVIAIDQGETNDIHPRKKHEIALRLVRMALAKNYGYRIQCNSPEFKNISFETNKAKINFDCFGSKLQVIDNNKPIGFSICGSDGIWYSATGKMIDGFTLEIWSDLVNNPIAVRYAWSDVPECNLFSKEGLPVAPFRTDNFEY